MVSVVFPAGTSGCVCLFVSDWQYCAVFPFMLPQSLYLCTTPLSLVPTSSSLSRSPLSLPVSPVPSSGLGSSGSESSGLPADDGRTRRGQRLLPLLWCPDLAPSSNAMSPSPSDHEDMAEVGLEWADALMVMDALASLHKCWGKPLLVSTWMSSPVPPVTV